MFNKQELVNFLWAKAIAVGFVCVDFSAIKLDRFRRVIEEY